MGSSIIIFKNFPVKIQFSRKFKGHPIVGSSLCLLKLRGIGANRSE
jgi:hypothetical protein